MEAADIRSPQCHKDLHENNFGCMVLTVGKHSLFKTARRGSDDMYMASSVQTKTPGIGAVALVGAVATGLALTAVMIPSAAQAQTRQIQVESRAVPVADVFTRPVYLPTRKAALLGCVKTNCTTNGKPDHGYWALDFTAPRGQDIYAAGGGIAHIEVKPVLSQCRGGTVWIDHGGGNTSRYVHLGILKVREGQVVNQNTVIGTFGGDHCNSNSLHFSVRTNGLRPVLQSDYPGELRACLDGRQVTFPKKLGYSNWDRVPYQTRTVSSEGTSCWPKPVQAGPVSGVKLKFKKKKWVQVKWVAPRVNARAVTAYRIGYRHYSTDKRAWTKQYFVTAKANARSIKVKENVFKTNWEISVASYDASGASPWVIKRQKFK